MIRFITCILISVDTLFKIICESFIKKFVTSLPKLLKYNEFEYLDLSRRDTNDNYLANFINSIDFFYFFDSAYNILQTTHIKYGLNQDVFTKGDFPFVLTYKFQYFINHKHKQFYSQFLHQIIMKYLIEFVNKFRGKNLSKIFQASQKMYKLNIIEYKFNMFERSFGNFLQIFTFYSMLPMQQLLQIPVDVNSILFFIKFYEYDWTTNKVFGIIINNQQHIHKHIHINIQVAIMQYTLGQEQTVHLKYFYLFRNDSKNKTSILNKIDMFDTSKRITCYLQNKEFKQKIQQLKKEFAAVQPFDIRYVIIVTKQSINQVIQSQILQTNFTYKKLIFFGKKIDFQNLNKFEHKNLFIQYFQTIDHNIYKFLKKLQEIIEHEMEQSKQRQVQQLKLKKQESATTSATSSHLHNGQGKTEQLRQEQQEQNANNERSKKQEFNYPQQKTPVLPSSKQSNYNNKTYKQEKKQMLEQFDNELYNLRSQPFQEYKPRKIQQPQDKLANIQQNVKNKQQQNKKTPQIETQNSTIIQVQIGIVDIEKNKSQYQSTNQQQSPGYLHSCNNNQVYTTKNHVANDTQTNQTQQMQEKKEQNSLNIQIWEATTEQIYINKRQASVKQESIKGEPNAKRSQNFKGDKQTYSCQDLKKNTATKQQSLPIFVQNQNKQNPKVLRVKRRQTNHKNMDKIIRSSINKEINKDQQYLNVNKTVNMRERPNSENNVTQNLQLKINVLREKRQASRQNIIKINWFDPSKDRNSSLARSIESKLNSKIELITYDYMTYQIEQQIRENETTLYIIIFSNTAFTSVFESRYYPRPNCPVYFDYCGDQNTANKIMRLNSPVDEIRIFTDGDQFQRELMKHVQQKYFQIFKENL